MKTNRKPNYDGDTFKMCVKGKGSLKLQKPSKDKDKKRIKKEKKKKRQEEFERLKKEELEMSAQIGTRRRFENQSGRRDPEKLTNGLTRNEHNKIKVLEKREVETLLKEGELSYGEKQRRYNKACQEVTETNEMPCLVMTKIK